MAIFDITTYGAVLNDTADCGPAISAAIDAAIAAGGGIIWHPGGGIARVLTGIGSKNANVSLGDNQGFYEFAGRGGGTSVYRLDELGNTSLFNIANASKTYIHDLVILPGPNWDGSGSAAIIQINGSWQTLIERLDILGVGTTSTGGIIWLNNTQLKIRDCFFGGCAAPAAGVVQASNSRVFVMENCQFIDYHVWKGVGYNKLGALNTKHWVRLTTTLPRQQQNPVWKINDCSFDENTSVSLLKFEGDDAVIAEVNNVFVNGGYGLKPSIIAEDLRELRVQDMEFGGLTVDPYTSIQARNVKKVTLNGVIHDYGARDVDLFDGSDRVQISDCINLTLSPEDGLEPIVQVD